MKKIDTFSLTYNLVFLLSALLIIAGIILNILGVSTVYSLSLRVNLIIYFLLFVVFVAYKAIELKRELFRSSEFKTIILVLCSTILLFLCSLYKLDRQYLSLSYFNKALMSLSFLLQVTLLTHFKMLARLKKIICFLSIVFIFLILMLYIFKFRTEAKSSYMGTSNPNEAAVYLCTFAMFSYLGVRLFKFKFLKLLSILAFLIGCVLIFLTGSRNCFIAIVLCMVLLFVFSLSDIKEKNFLNILFVLSPLIVMMIYMIIAYLFIDSFAMNYYGSKSIATRKAIWNVGLKQFIGSPIFGNYYQQVVVSPLEQDLPLYTITQFHSTAVDTLATYGFPFFVVQSIIIIRFLNFGILLPERSRYEKQSHIPFAFSSLFIFMGFFEGGIYLSMFCAISIILLLISGEITYPIVKQKSNIIICYFKSTGNLIVYDGYTPYCFFNVKATLVSKILTHLVFYYYVVFCKISKRKILTNLDFRTAENNVIVQDFSEETLLKYCSKQTELKSFLEITI